MLKIRLQRVGRKNDPSFRIVVMPKQKDSQSGKVVEILGSYNARQGKPQIKADRVKHWIAAGAQVSGTVHNLLVGQKIIEGKKINVLPKRKSVENVVEKIEDRKEEIKVDEPVAAEEIPVVESPAENVPAN